jgi:hypothetical protein
MFLTKPTHTKRQYGMAWLHPGKSFSAPSYHPIEPALRAHIANRRPDWTEADITREVGLWYAANPKVRRPDAGSGTGRR